MPQMYRKVGCIKNLEVASICNLACPYCPASGQGEFREVGLMSDEIFERSMYWLNIFVAQGTQRELNLFGVGEPFLHPKYVEMVKRCRAIMPKYLQLRLNTNGLLATYELLYDVLAAGADAIDVTDHEAASATRTLHYFRMLKKEFPNATFGYSRDGIRNPNNWGGLVNWITWEPEHERSLCPWLAFGQVMIMSNGDVARCCQDAHSRGTLGTVWDNLREMDHTPFIQCNTCHEDVPQGMPRSLINTNPKTQRRKAG